LILGGAADLRTPAEGALALAGKFPRASTLIVPRTGHDALGTDLSGCATRALERFLVAKPVEPTCPRASRAIEDLIGLVLYPPTPVPPRHLAQLGTPRHLRGRAGRTLRAAELTFLDALLQILSTDLSAEQPVRLARIGGLRDGRLLVRYEPRVSVRLDRYSYVPGTWVSTHIRKLSRSKVRLRVGGRKAARGRLLFNVRRDRISGRLGGRRVHVNLTRDIEEAVGGLNVLRTAMRASGRATSRCCSASEVLGRR
jgi:hypothetical protein